MNNYIYALNRIKHEVIQELEETDVFSDTYGCFMEILDIIKDSHKNFDKRLILQKHTKQSISITVKENNKIIYADIIDFRVPNIDKIIKSLFVAISLSTTVEYNL